MDKKSLLVEETIKAYNKSIREIKSDFIKKADLYDMGTRDIVDCFVAFFCNTVFENMSFLSSFIHVFNKQSDLKKRKMLDHIIELMINDAHLAIKSGKDHSSSFKAKSKYFNNYNSKFDLIKGDKD